MKAIHSILAATLLMAGSLLIAQDTQTATSAQKPLRYYGPSEDRVDAMVGRIAWELDLKDDQEKKVLELYQAHHESVRAKVDAGNAPTREEMETLQEELHTKVRAMLTEYQKGQYDTMVKRNPGAGYYGRSMDNNGGRSRGDFQGKSQGRHARR
ncbi:MAG: hypothetical protein R2751_07190 [Bacteroidales bacterium]